MIENDGDLEWACANCPKTKQEDLHPYIHKLLRIRAEQYAGCPIDRNDLTPEEWLDLAKIKQLFEPQLQCPLMSKKKDE